MVDATHEFGGVWTETKLNAISDYSKLFIKTIGSTFDLCYVDPFAGTGERTSTETDGGLFENRAISTVERQYPGSAARALSLDPPFDHYRLGDTHKRHVGALEQLVQHFPDYDAQVVRSDGNAFIQSMFGAKYWTDPADGPGTPRALVFLDPYGLEVEWKTLEVLAACQKADVWFLTNLKAANQQLCYRHQSFDASKRRTLRKCFGTNDWEAEFYTTRQTPDLLGLIEQTTERIATKHDVARYHRSRLQTLFCSVSEPLPLAVGAHDDYFLLYCMSNNPRPKARGLISRLASAVIRTHTQASRHKSGR